MNREELLARLQTQKQHLEQELIDRIVQIENINASIQIIEGKEPTQPNYPPQNPFQGVPIPRIAPETYITIARRLIDNRNNVRTPGIRGEPLVRELNSRIREVEELINRLDYSVEQLVGTQDTQTARKIKHIQDDRDKLCIELEFYKDLSEGIQIEPRKLTKEELEEERYQAKDWWKRRNPGK
jgi:hypothetical protein